MPAATTALGLEERLRLVVDVCEAVTAAHRRLVVHRDLKPSNILVTPRRQVKLLDFGIAKLLAGGAGGGGDAHAAAARVLTPAYAAPEQILGEPVTTATDVYALGVLLYELLTGALPHTRSAGRLPRWPARAARRDGRAAERGPAGGRERGRQPASSTAAVPPGQVDLDRCSPPCTATRAALRLGGRARRGSRAVPRGEADPGRRGFRALPGAQAPAAPQARRGGALAAVLSLAIGIAVAAREARIATAQAQRAERVKGLLLSIFREADPERGRGRS